MTKIIIYTIIVLFSQIGLSQDILFSEKIDFLGSERMMKEMQFCSDKSDQNLAVFFFSDLNNYALLLDSNLVQTNILSGAKPKLLFTSNIGQSKVRELYYSYYTEGLHNKLYAHVFDFIRQKVVFREVKLNFEKGETVLSKFVTKNKLIFLTVKKQTSELKYYEFEGMQLMVEKTFILKDKDFPHFLGDNLSNCISHDVLRPVNLNLLYNYSSFAALGIQLMP